MPFMQICLPIPLVLLALLCIPAPRYLAALRVVRNGHFHCYAPSRQYFCRCPSQMSIWQSQHLAPESLYPGRGACRQ